MKHLILILLSFNAYAELRIDIVNNVTGKSYGDDRSEQDAQVWISKNIANNTWGKKDRWKEKQLGQVCDLERQTGNVVDGFVTECFYPATYTICGKNPDQVNIATDCQDITAEVQAKKDKKIADEATMETIKTAISNGTAKLEDIINYIKIKEGL